MARAIAPAPMYCTLISGSARSWFEKIGDRGRPLCRWAGVSLETAHPAIDPVKRHAQETDQEEKFGVRHVWSPRHGRCTSVFSVERAKPRELPKWTLLVAYSRH